MHNLVLIKHSEKNGKNFFTLDADGNTDEPIRLLKTALAYAFGTATHSTTLSEEVEVTKYFENISIIMRLLTNKGQGFLSHFDEIDEPQTGFKGFSQKKDAN